MLQGTLKSKYRSRRTNQFVYTYTVTGKPKEIEQFTAAKGEFNVIDEESGAPLHFITEYDASGFKRLIQPVINLTITKNGNIVTDDMADELALNKQIKAVLADKIADKMADNYIRRQAPVQQAAVQNAGTNVKEVETPNDILEKIAQGNQPPVNQPEDNIDDQQQQQPADQKTEKAEK